MAEPDFRCCANGFFTPSDRSKGKETRTIMMLSFDEKREMMLLSLHEKATLFGRHEMTNETNDLGPGSRGIQRKSPGSFLRSRFPGGSLADGRSISSSAFKHEHMRILMFSFCAEISTRSAHSFKDGMFKKHTKSSYLVRGLSRNGNRTRFSQLRSTTFGAVRTRMLPGRSN